MLKISSDFSSIINIKPSRNLSATDSTFKNIVLMLCMIATLAIKIFELYYQYLDKKLINKLNANYDLSLHDGGLQNFSSIEAFLKIHGKKLKHLNFGHMKIGKQEFDDDEFEQLIKYCPNIESLFISSRNLTGRSFKHLNKLPLKSVYFPNCFNLTDLALEN